MLVASGQLYLFQPDGPQHLLSRVTNVVITDDVYRARSLFNSIFDHDYVGVSFPNLSRTQLWMWCGTYEGVNHSLPLCDLSCEGLLINVKDPVQAIRLPHLTRIPEAWACSGARPILRPGDAFQNVFFICDKPEVLTRADSEDSDVN